MNSSIILNHPDPDIVSVIRLVEGWKKFAINLKGHYDAADDLLKIDQKQLKEKYNPNAYNEFIIKAEKKITTLDDIDKKLTIFHRKFNSAKLDTYIQSLLIYQKNVAQIRIELYACIYTKYAIQIQSCNRSKAKKTGIAKIYLMKKAFDILQRLNNVLKKYPDPSDEFITSYTHDNESKMLALVAEHNAIASDKIIYHTNSVSNLIAKSRLSNNINDALKLLDDAFESAIKEKDSVDQIDILFEKHTRSRDKYHKNYSSMLPETLQNVAAIILDPLIQAYEILVEKNLENMDAHCLYICDHLTMTAKVITLAINNTENIELSLSLARYALDIQIKSGRLMEKSGIAGDHLSFTNQLQYNIQFLEEKKIKQEQDQLEKQKALLEFEAEQQAYEKMLPKILKSFEEIPQKKNIIILKHCATKRPLPVDSDSSSSEEEENHVNDINIDSSLQDFNKFTLSNCIKIMNDPEQNSSYIDKVKAMITIAEHFKMQAVSILDKHRDDYRHKAIAMLSRSVAYLYDASTMLLQHHHNQSDNKLRDCINIPLDETKKLMTAIIIRQQKIVDEQNNKRLAAKDFIINHYGHDAWYKNNGRISKLAQIRQMEVSILLKLHRIESKLDFIKFQMQLNRKIKSSSIINISSIKQQHTLFQPKFDLKRERSISMDSSFFPLPFQNELMKTNKYYIMPRLFKPQTHVKRRRSASLDAISIKPTEHFRSR